MRGTWEPESGQFFELVRAGEPSWESNGNKSLSSHVRWGERGAPVCFDNYLAVPSLIALRICASASSLQYLQLSCRKTEV